MSSTKIAAKAWKTKALAFASALKIEKNLVIHYTPGLHDKFKII